MPSRPSTPYRAALAVLGIAASSLAAPAGAQTTSTGTATITMNTVLYISVTNASQSFTPTATDLNAGFMAGGSTSSLVTKANVTHSVNVKANAATFTGPAGTSKPSTDLQVAVTPFGGSIGSYAGLTTSGVSVLSSRAAGDYASSAYTVTYKALLGYAADIPGTYTLGITYTITSP